MPRRVKFNSGDVELDDRSLFIKDLTLGKFVYDAAQIAGSFRLVVDGAVLCSEPDGVTAVCPATTTKLWSSHDMTWDDQGCLVILDARLATALKEVYANTYSFRIDVPLKAVDPTDDDNHNGGIGENKINAMCLC